MKKLSRLFTLLLAISVALLVGCQPKQVEMSAKQKASLADTISMLMNQLISSAEATNAEETGAVLMMDSTSIFFQTGMPYSHCEMISIMDSLYNELEWQKINFEFTQVFVLSPEAALWVGYGTNVLPTADGEEILKITDTWLWQKKHGKWGVYHFHESAVPVVE